MSTAADLPTFLAAAVEAARRGAAELEAWRDRFTVTEKGPADLVTEADVASQKAIKAYLLGRFPDHGFLGEEESVGRPLASMRPAAGSPPVWVVDPLDGTANYAHGVPAYCVNIALLVDGTPQVGVTFDPRLNELFTAYTGGGAFLNGKPIRVSSAPTIRDGLLATGFPADYGQQIRNLDAWRRVSAHAQALRRTGSTAINMAYVACGRFDGYWCYDNWPWDVLPGAVLILEAGGTLTTTDGGPFDPFRMDVIATNGRLHAELVRALAEPA
jgi:myo-inositol-1(or 4)-monophosphatase